MPQSRQQLQEMSEQLSLNQAKNLTYQVGMVLKTASGGYR